MSPEKSESARDHHDAVSLESLLGQLSRLGSDDPYGSDADGSQTDANKAEGSDTDVNRAEGKKSKGRVSVGDIIHVVGDRSFAPLLMLVGMLLVSPLSGVPTFPSMMAGIVLLVTLQMLYGRKHFWLPARLLNVQVPVDKLHTALHWLQPPARFVDRITKQRLTILVRGPSIYVIAMICLSIACLLPVMELILFSSSVAGAVLLMFGVALVSRDGLLALLGYSATAITVWLIMSALQ